MKYLRPLCSCATYAALLLFPISTWSLPHVFPTSSARVVFDEKGIADIRIQWAFDDMFSSSLMLDFEKWKREFHSHRVSSYEIGVFHAIAESRLLHPCEN